MGKATVYCESCGEVIPGDDFDKGRAVHFQEKDYCAKCKNEISHLLPPADDSDALARKTSRIRTVDPNSSSSVRKSSGVRSPQGGARRTVQASAVSSTPARGSPRLASGNGNRDHPSQLHAPTVRPPATGGEKTLYIVGGAAVLIVVVVLAVVSVSKKSAVDKEAQARAARDQAAKEAYEGCAAFRKGSQDLDGLLRLIELARPRVQGTDWEVQLTQMQKDAEKEKQDRKRRADLSDQIDGLRNGVKNDPANAKVLKSEIERLRDLVGDDQELKDKIAAALEEERQAEFQARVNEANTFVQTNPNDYKGALDKYTELKRDLESFPDEFKSLQAPLIEDAIRRITESRELDASSCWQSAQGAADALRAQHDYGGAIREVNKFLLDETFQMCKARKEAETYLADLRREEEAWREEQQQQPPQQPQDPPPGPGPSPPAGAVSLFDGQNRPGVTMGEGKAAWDVVNGELHVKHQVDQLPDEKGRSTISEFVLFNSRQAEKCVFSFEAKVVKGAAAAFLGMRRDGAGMKFTSAVTMNGLADANWHRFTLEFDGHQVNLTQDGSTGQVFQPQDPGKGSAGLGIYSGCEVYFRNITLTEK